MKELHRWTTSVISATGSTERFDYRLLQDKKDSAKFAIERCERDRVGGERWLDVSEWDRDAALRGVLKSGLHPVSVILAEALIQLKASLSQTTFVVGGGGGSNRGGGHNGGQYGGLA